MDAHVKNVREASEANAADPAKAGLEKSGIAGTEPAEDKEAKVRREKIGEKFQIVVPLWISFLGEGEGRQGGRRREEGRGGNGGECKL